MLENTILSTLVSDQEYIRKVIPYIDRDYFKDMGEKIVFSLIRDHFLKYNKPPTKSSLQVDLHSKKLKESFFEQASEVLDSLKQEPVDVNWLVDATEDFCKKRAFLNAMIHASDLMDKDDTTLYHGALDQVTKALAVSFDSDLGSDYFEDADKRFDKYKQGTAKVRCDLDIFNFVTKGGFVNPSLTVFVAPTGVGKSMFLCNIAASFLRMGKNVVYFTMEMAEEQVEQRIDLNLLDMTVDQLDLLDKVQFVNRIVNLQKKTHGRLKTKGYVSGSAHSGHFRYFLEELKIKEGFVPDIIIVDYLNICASARTTKATGLYDFNATISVELRGLGQEFSCPVFTATQTNRDGTRAADFESTDIADSWGIAFNADYMYGIIETEQLALQNQMKIKRLKDRYNDYTSWWPSFLVGVDKTKQRIYDINDHNDNQQDFIKSNVDEEFETLMGQTT